MRAFLVCPSAELREEFQSAPFGFSNLTLLKSLEVYPSEEAFGRLIRSWAPEVIFVSLEDPESATRICAQLNAEFRDLQRIGIAPAADPPSFRLALRLKMAELLTPPFEDGETARILREVELHLAAHPATIGCCDRVFAFMPAKAGVGASTLAANLHRTFHSIPGTRPLLADFDLDSGILNFLFNVDHDFCAADALRSTTELDDHSCERLIRKTENFDLLLSGAPRIADQAKNPAQLKKLVQFLRRNYDVVCADLSDSFNELSLAMMHEANHIFLVTTPELTSLRLARQKALLFQKLEIGDRVSLLLNRVNKRMELSVEDIEETVGLPVLASFPCDYAAVTRGIRDGRPPNSWAEPLRDLAEKSLAKRFREVKKNKFIERFAVVPMRYSFR